MVSVSDPQSSGPGFESRSDLDLFLGSPEFKSTVTLVKSQLVCLRPVGISLNNANYVQFELLVSVVCSAP